MEPTLQRGCKDSFIKYVLSIYDIAGTVGLGCSSENNRQVPGFMNLAF